MVGFNKYGEVYFMNYIRRTATHLSQEEQTNLGHNILKLYPLPLILHYQKKQRRYYLVNESKYYYLGGVETVLSK